ncbi:MAG: hypothetical protein ACLGIJ_12125 [Candidatus Limnocylindria bacterium]
MTRARGLARASRAVGLAMVALVAGACGGGTPASPSGADEPASAPPQTRAPGEPRPGIDAPPAAVVAVDGGDPVVGQLGTWTWGQAGSSSPWLPGAPIAVGRGETLSLALDPPVDVGTWSASYVPVDAAGPRDARPLAAGQGEPRIAVPPPGDWTMVVQVEFAGGLGSAHYAWAVTVR